MVALLDEHEPEPLADRARQEIERVLGAD
jgi:hypothetical protein